MVKTFQLDNGIRIIAKRINGFKSLSMGVFVGVGSACETDAENGISHFIEHVNFKGTKKRTAFEVSRDPEALGVMINAATSKEYTYYYAKTLSEHTEKVLEILSDIFIDSVYPPHELEREKGVVIEEINMYEDTPDDVCTNALSRAVFGGGTGYGKAILGTKTNVRSFDREAVLAYKKKYYTTDNVVLSFAGALDFEKIFELCKRYFDRMPATKKSREPERNLVNLCKTSVRRKEIEQEHLALGFSAPKTDGEDLLEYNVIVNVLGGGMSSRLFQTVREQLGLCYTIDAYMQPYNDCGMWGIYAGVGAGASAKTIAAIKEQLDILKKNGITAEEFSYVKEQIKSSMVFVEESTTALMNVYGKRYLLQGDVYDPEKRMKEMNGLDHKKVNEVVFERLDTERFALSKVLGK